MNFKNKLNFGNYYLIDEMQSKINFILKMLSNSFLKYTNKKLYLISEKLLEIINENSEKELIDFIRNKIMKLPSLEILYLTRFLVFHEMLTNIVEDTYLVDKESKWEENNFLKEDELFKFLKQNKNKIITSECLKNLEINVVLTAHPTQVQRETVLKLIRKIMVLIDQKNNRTNIFDINLLSTNEEIQSLIDILWQVAILRDNKKNIDMELKGVLNFFDTTFFSIIPKINYKYDKVSSNVLETELTFNTPITINSWIGGDRDGNSFVDASSLEKVLNMQCMKIFSYYQKKLLKIYDDLLLHSSLAETSKQIKHFSNDISLPNRDNEYYAKSVIKIVSKLKNTWDKFNVKKEYEIFFDKAINIDEFYKDKNEFFKDIFAIYESLKIQNSDLIISRNLIDLMYAIKSFGFYLMSIDIRQNSKSHEQTIHEIFKNSYICNNYLELSEKQKINLLKDTLSKEDLEFNLNNLSEDSFKEIEIFNRISKMKHKYGDDCIKNYLISNSESYSDILEVMVLFKLSNLYFKNIKNMIKIVPLFETIKDLNGCREIVSEMIEDSWFLKIIKDKWNNNLEILLGYSDSCKDGGYLTSSWEIYKVQKELSKIAEEKNINISFFHGRGGTIGRGGGPSYYAIKSQPTKSIKNKIRFTEQGEVIWAKYSNPRNGWFNLENILNATVEAVVTENKKVKDENSEFSKMMDELSSISFNKYQDLVYKNKNFSSIFYTITPINQISSLKIGSRPSSRKNNNAIETLRSIPWMFSWSQVRVMMPSWYGLGSSLKSKKEYLLKMQKWYTSIPFFNSLLSNVEMVLFKTNLNISKKYFEFSNNKEALEIFENIKNELYETKKIILKIMNKNSLLEDFDYLKLSLKYRLPFLNALNYFQIELMIKDKEIKNDKQIKEAILMTINGIATGLRNSG